MSTLKPEELEAKLHAQREFLVALAASVAEIVPDTERFWRALEDAAPLQNHQEDPGVLVSSAFAIAGASALEYEAILDSARKRFEAG